MAGGRGVGGDSLPAQPEKSSSPPLESGSPGSHRDGGLHMHADPKGLSSGPSPEPWRLPWRPGFYPHSSRKGFRTLQKKLQPPHAGFAVSRDPGRLRFSSPTHQLTEMAHTLQSHTLHRRDKSPEKGKFRRPANAGGPAS